MNRKAIFCLLVLFLIQVAHADSIKDALSHKYKNQVLVLRSPYTTADQKFDSSGHSLNAPPNSAWLLYGGIYVEKLNLSSDTLRLEAPRAALTNKNGQRTLVRFSKAQQIEIHLDHPLKSLEDAQAILGRVFFLGTNATEHAKPELRRADDTTPDDQIYDCHQDGVTAPKPIFTPEPDFSEEARRKKFQGNVILSIVVDKMGTVARIRMDKVLGHGLDEHGSN
jgi:hypothetical protein